MNVPFLRVEGNGFATISGLGFFNIMPVAAPPQNNPPAKSTVDVGDTLTDGVVYSTTLSNFNYDLDGFDGTYKGDRNDGNHNSSTGLNMSFVASNGSYFPNDGDSVTFTFYFKDFAKGRVIFDLAPDDNFFASDRFVRMILNGNTTTNANSLIFNDRSNTTRAVLAFTGNSSTPGTNNYILANSGTTPINIKLTRAGADLVVEVLQADLSPMPTPMSATLDAATYANGVLSAANIDYLKISELTSNGGQGQFDILISSSY